MNIYEKKYIRPWENDGAGNRSPGLFKKKRARMKRFVSFKHTAHSDWLMANKHKIHANSSQARSKCHLEMKLKQTQRVLAVHNAQDPKFTKMHKTYIIRILIHPTLTIQHQFLLTLTTWKESSKTKSNNQYSNPYILLKSQWNHTIQLAACSIMKDLPKP